MPQKGEIRYGREIGYKSGGRKFMWAACTECDKGRWVFLINGKPNCLRCNSCARKGNTNSRGAGRYNSHGYILVKLHPSDFFFPMANSDGYVFEHRLVMAKFLGRCLQLWEIVHHKPGIAKDDNRIAGLKLTSRVEHIHADEEAVKQLTRIVAEQTKEIRLLRWQVKKLNADMSELRQLKLVPCYQC